MRDDKAQGRCLLGRGLIGKQAGEMVGPVPKLQPSCCTCQPREWKSLLASPVLVGFCSTWVSRPTRSCHRKGSQGWDFHFISSNSASSKKWGKLANISVVGMRSIPELGVQLVGAALSSGESRKAFFWGLWLLPEQGQRCFMRYGRACNSLCSTL